MQRVVGQRMFAEPKLAIHKQKDWLMSFELENTVSRLSDVYTLQREVDPACTRSVSTLTSRL
jgi:hypothetical protein